MARVYSFSQYSGVDLALETTWGTAQTTGFKRVHPMVDPGESGRLVRDQIVTNQEFTAFSGRTSYDYGRGTVQGSISMIPAYNSEAFGILLRELHGGAIETRNVGKGPDAVSTAAPSTSYYTHAFFPQVFTDTTTGYWGGVAKGLTIRGWKAGDKLGAASTAVPAAGGSGYSVNDTITLTGGTFSQAAVLTVATVSTGAVTSVTITTPGNYSVLPSNPVAQGSTSGSGTGATFTMEWAGWVDIYVGCIITGLVWEHRQNQPPVATFNFIGKTVTESAATVVNAVAPLAATPTGLITINSRDFKNRAAAHAASATIAAGGTGYSVNNILTVTGGASSQASQFRVSSVSGGAVTAVTVEVAGSYSSIPSDPVATSGGGGSGCTLNVTWSNWSSVFRGRWANGGTPLQDIDSFTMTITSGLEIPQSFITDPDTVSKPAHSGLWGCTVQVNERLQDGYAVDHHLYFTSGSPFVNGIFIAYVSDTNIYDGGSDAQRMPWGIKFQFPNANPTDSRPNLTQVGAGQDVWSFEPTRGVVAASSSSIASDRTIPWMMQLVTSFATF